MRCDSSSTFAAITQFMRSGQDDAVVTLPPPNRRDAVDYECPRQASTVRLIRQVTPDGKVRVLMTSLLDHTRYPAPTFAELYHRRWRIEEAFKRLKHRLSLERKRLSIGVIAGWSAMRYRSAGGFRRSAASTGAV